MCCRFQHRKTASSPNDPADNHGGTVHNDSLQAFRWRPFSHRTGLHALLFFCAPISCSLYPSDHQSVIPNCPSRSDVSLTCGISTLFLFQAGGVDRGSSNGDLRKLSKHELLQKVEALERINQELYQFGVEELMTEVRNVTDEVEG